MSLPLHAPADGVIESIELKPARAPLVESIVLRVYEASTRKCAGRIRQMSRPCPRRTSPGRSRRPHCRHGRRRLPRPRQAGAAQDAVIDTLVVNGAECEPYLTCDHRVMLEYPDDVMRGIQLAMRACGAPRAVVGIETTSRCVEMLRRHIPADAAITVEPVKTKYPQGAARPSSMPFWAARYPGQAQFRRRRAGEQCHDPGLCGPPGAAGEGVIERVVTVAGPASSGRALPGADRHADALPDGICRRQGSERQIILGGPMMGESVASLDVPSSRALPACW